MILIWKGFGFLVPLIWVASLLATFEVLGTQTYEQHGWPKFVACLIAAIAISVVRDKVNKSLKTGDTHTFFGLDMDVWSLIVLVLGVVFWIKS